MSLPQKSPPCNLASPHPAAVFERRPSCYPVRRIEAVPLPAGMAETAAAWTRPQTALGRRLDQLARDVGAERFQAWREGLADAAPAERYLPPADDEGEILDPVSEPLPGPECGWANPEPQGHDCGARRNGNHETGSGGAPNRPSYVFVEPAETPALAHLKSFKQWVNWDYVWCPKKNDGKGKWDKPPKGPGGYGVSVSPSASARWRNYADVVNGVRNGRTGIGFVLHPTADDIKGLDIDNCIDPVTGAFALWIDEIIALGETYAEISPSGCGIRFFVQGKDGKVCKCDPAGVEIYESGRYLTFTGNHVPGTPNSIGPAARTVAALLARVAEFQTPKPEPGASNRPAEGDTFWGRVNSAALGNIGAWAPELFPDGQWQATGAFRVSSAALGRDLEEDLSIHPDGIWDFGTEKPMTAIDVVMEWAPYDDPMPAALWLCERLGLDAVKLGYVPDVDVDVDDDDDDENTQSQPPASGRPVILLVAGRLPRIINEVEEALVNADLGLYLRAGRIVHIVEEVFKRPDETETMVVVINEVNDYALLETMARTARFLRRTKDGTLIKADPPLKLVKHLKGREYKLHFPPLADILTTPLLLQSGQLIDKPGYDAATRMYFEPLGTVFPPIPENPTREDALAALEILLELLSEFPFVDEASRSVAISAILTAVGRRAIDLAPMHANSAHEAGTGKSYLMDLISMIATGRRAPVLAMGKSEEEFEKRLDGMLFKGVGFIAIDNVKTAVESAKLAMILSQPRIQIRILGGNKLADMPEIEQRIFVGMTGNNLTIIDELNRRTLCSCQDAKEERPELREFQKDPIAMVKADRGKYVVAALIIIRAFMLAGAGTQAKPLKNYDEWSRMIRDALIWLGRADPVETQETSRENDPSLIERQVVVENWWAEFGSKRMTARGLVAAALEREPAPPRPADAEPDWQPPRMPRLRPGLYAALMDVAEKGNQLDVRTLSFWLSANQGRVANGKYFTHAEKGMFGITWRLWRKGHEIEDVDGFDIVDDDIVS